jgi:hypothetical protein
MRRRNLPVIHTPKWLGNRHREQSRFVYLIGCTEPRCFKIGFAGNVEDRLENMVMISRSRSPIIDQWETYHFWDLEKALHKRFASKRIGQRTRSEWFCLSEEEVVECRAIGASWVRHHTPVEHPPLTPVNPDF